MKIVRFYATGCLYVSRFLSLLSFLISTELAQSFAHNYFSFLIMFVFLQGGRVLALKIAHLKDSELCKLAADLPLRTIEAKAPSTTDRYSRAFQIQRMVFTLQRGRLPANGRDISCSLFRVPDSGWFPLFFP